MASGRVFLSYNSQNKTAAMRLCALLRLRGLDVWIDQDLCPGQPWSAHLESALEETDVTLAVIGSEGLGPWQKKEVEFSFQEEVKGRRRVVPVLLPGVDQASIKLPFTLQANTWVIFGSAVDEDDQLDRIEWAVTGRKPTPRSASVAEPPKPTRDESSEMSLNDAVSDIVKNLALGNATFVLGKEATSDDPAFSSERVRAADVLLRALEFVEHGVPGEGNADLNAERRGTMPPFEVAATYYAVRHGDANLEDCVTNLDKEKDAEAYDPYKVLVAVLVRLEKLRQKDEETNTRRQSECSPQLIVTTSFDLSLERALLRAGVPFTRVVQCRESAIGPTPFGRIEVKRFVPTPVEDGDLVSLARVPSAVLIPTKDARALDAAIRSHPGKTVRSKGEQPLALLKDVRDVIVYKYLGSSDVKGSCTISAEQHYSLARAVLKQVVFPSTITSLIHNSPIVYVGCRVLDPEFRTTYWTLMKDYSNPNYRQYAVQSRVFGDSRDLDFALQKTLWEKLKIAVSERYRVRILDARAEEFLTRLHQALV